MRWRVIVRAVLTFHGIDDRGGPLSFPPRLFDLLLETLARGALPIVDLDALLDPATKHGVALTFDDGLRSVYAAALPVLRDHRAPAHLFLSTGAVGDRSSSLGQTRSEMLSWDAVEQLHASGIAIESHTHRHPDLRMLRDDDIETECATADALIERRLGRQPRYFAYPFGHHDARVCGRVAARYAAAFTTSLGFLSPRDERARLPRVDAYYLRPSLVHRHPTAPATRAYLRLRKLLRLIRGTE